MKRALSAALPALALLLAAPAALAQDALALPAPSPLARVMQTVGVAEVTVEYSSPGVKGRVAFGDLVPFGELWRTGANAATKLTLSHDGTVGGKPVPAGTYAVFTIPGKDGWTFILNKNPNQGGTRSYDEKLDQLRLTVKPEAAPPTERMTFVFANTTDDETRLDLVWEGTRVSVPIAFDTAKLARASVDGYAGDASGKLARAARYLAEGGKDLDTALALIDASIAIKPGWFNTYLKADIMAQKGDLRAAQTLGQKAWDMGEKDSYFWGRDMVRESLANWKKKKR